MRKFGSASVVLAFLFVCAAPMAQPKREAAPRPPNIVLIFADDLGWTDLACYGSRFYETPNIDRLAREGMRFTDAYAAAAQCAPTDSNALAMGAPSLRSR